MDVLGMRLKTRLIRSDGYVERFASSALCPAGGVEVGVGRVEACLVRRGLAGVDVREACEADSAELGDFARWICDTVEGRFLGDVLYLHEAEVLPEYRGQGVGLVAVHRLLTDFAGCYGAAAYLPGTLEGEWTAEARRKLTRYWGHLGFVPMGDSGYRVLLRGRLRTLKTALKRYRSHKE